MESTQHTVAGMPRKLGNPERQRSAKDGMTKRLTSAARTRAIAWLVCGLLAGCLSVLGMALFVSTWESTTSVCKHAIISVICWPSLVYFTIGAPESSGIFTQFFLVNGVAWAVVLILAYEATSRIGNRPQNQPSQPIAGKPGSG